ncbi:hypothetical protein TNCV_680201 [Trichonephila clavipes]|nr:hypothetical protein TNCV_680201 [Trichonephila clavipes]
MNELDESSFRIIYPVIVPPYYFFPWLNILPSVSNSAALDLLLFKPSECATQGLLLPDHLDCVALHLLSSDPSDSTTTSSFFRW